jgi:hypothetical protein
MEKAIAPHPTIIDKIALPSVIPVTWFSSENS